MVSGLDMKRAEAVCVPCRWMTCASEQQARQCLCQSQEFSLGILAHCPRPAQQTSAYFQVCMQSTRHILILLITQLITLEHVKSHADNEPHHEQDH